MTLSINEIEFLIKKKLPDAVIIIEDIKGDNNHYRATIKSTAFKGLTIIQQHKLVYNAIGQHMGTTLHALMLTTIEQ